MKTAKVDVHDRARRRDTRNAVGAPVYYDEWIPRDPGEGLSREPYCPDPAAPHIPLERVLTICLVGIIMWCVAALVVYNAILHLHGGR